RASLAGIVTLCRTEAAFLAPDFLDAGTMSIIGPGAPLWCTLISVCHARLRGGRRPTLGSVGRPVGRAEHPRAARPHRRPERPAIFSQPEADPTDAPATQERTMRRS